MGKCFQFLTLTVIFILAANPLTHGQCGYSDTLQVPDFTSEQILLEITGANNNDLSSNNVCAVNLEFEHETIGDFIIELTSPDGQTITLLGPSGAFGSTEFTNWDVSFVQCSETANPDVGFSAQWSNDQFWGILGSYDGSYYPYNGCLEDLDSGPVNGVWTLNVIDNQQFDVGQLLDFEIIFCDPSGIDCAECYQPDITLEENDFTACTGGDVLEFVPEINVTYQDSSQEEDYSSFYIVSNQDTIYQRDTTVDLTGFEEGVYNICGIVAKNSELAIFENFVDTSTVTEIRDELNSESPRYCASISDDCMEIEILSQPDTVNRSEVICSGDFVVFRGEVYTDAGEYVQTVEPENGCDTTFILNISEVNIESEIDSVEEINCYNPEVVLDGSASIYSSQSTLEWFTNDGNIVGSGTGDSVIVNEGGTYYFVISELICTDTASVFVSSDTEPPEVEVEDDQLDCNTIAVRLDASTGDDYDSLEWSGPDGFTSTLLRPVVNKAGTYQLGITGTNGCESTYEINIEIDTVKPQVTAIQPNISCQGELINLEIEENFDPAFSYTWTSDNGFFAQAKDTSTFNEGTYVIEVVDTRNGCSTRDTLSVNDLDPSPTVNLSADTLGCYQSSVQIQNQVNLDSINFEWIGPGGFTSNQQSPIVFFPGLYEVNAETDNGCDVIDSIEVQGEYFVPDLSVIVDTLRCEDDTISLIASSSEDVIYEWTGPAGYEATGDTARVTLPGEYTVMISTSGGCGNSRTVEVIEDYVAGGVQLISDTIDCNNPSAEVKFISSQVDSFYWFTSDEEYVQDSVFTTQSGGFHFFHFKDVNGCSSTRPIKTVSDTFPPEVIYDIPKFGCYQDSVQIVIPTSEAIQYSWSGPNGFTSTEQNPWVYEVGDYALEALGDNGCILFDTVSVVYDTIPPPVQVNGLDLGCKRDSVTLSVENTSTNYSYNWIGSTGFNSSEAAPKVGAPGIYSVTVTASNNCIGMGSIDIVYDTIPPVLSLQGDTLSCNSATVTLLASANVNDVDYTWYFNNSVASSDSTLTTGESREYTVIGERSNTCSDTIVYDLISDDDVPDFTVTIDTLDCNTQSFRPTVQMDTTDIVSISWTGPSNFNSDQLEPLITEAGNYQFEFTLENGCIGGSEYMVIRDTAAPADNLNSTYVIDCDEPTIELDSRLSDVEYQTYWLHSGDTISEKPVLTLNNPGLYEFTAIGSNGCILDKDITVGIDTVHPVLDIRVDTINCKVTKVRADIEADDSTYSYKWSGPDNFNASIKEPFFNQPGFYSVAVKDTNGCVSNYTFPVIGDTLNPVINLEDGSLSCDDGTYKLKLGSASPIQNVRWFGPNSFFTEQKEPRVDQAGEYRVIVISPNGCFSMDTLTVDESPEYPEFEIEKYGADCYGDSIYTRVIPEEGDDYIYNWFYESTLISESSMLKLDGSKEYNLSILDTFNGCSIDTLIKFNPDSILPNAVITQEDPILCDKSNAILKSENGSSGNHIQYSWSSDGSSSISSPKNLPSIQVNGTGTFYLEITDTRNGCVDNDTIVVDTTRSTLSSINLSTDKQSCYDRVDGSIKISNVKGGMPPYEYSLNNEPFGEVSFYSELDSGLYNIRVKDNYGCIIDTVVSLSRESLPTVSIGRDTTITLGSKIQLRPKINVDTSSIQKKWNPSEGVNCVDCAFTSVLPNRTTEYTFTITDSLGCAASDMRKITVIQQGGVYVPNAFTPNGDHINDFLRPYFSNNVSVVNQFSIYNRWGNKVFSINDVSPSSEALRWDGTAHGELLSPQVFHYKLSFILKSGRQFVKNGTITLLR